jgi:ubiquinone/menaquinone biosynthesis C-methylase UbiE
LRASYWESYYRGGAIAACPTGPDGNYTLELREIWIEFFAALADRARLLDIGTGNGAIPLIARQTADSLKRSYEIHGADLARINPVRDVAGGAQLFAGIAFHPGVAAEELPFEDASFAAVSGQYALEYTDVPRSLAEIMRVLAPGAAARFLMHHAGSIVIERARASLRHADVVLSDTKVYRKVRRFLEAEKRSPAGARRAWDELSGAMATLRDTARSEPDRRVIDVTLDAIPKLLDQRRSLAPAALEREIDAVENDLRYAGRRQNDLIEVALSDSAMAQCAERARAQGFVDVNYRAVNHAQHVLVGWLLCLRKPL